MRKCRDEYSESDSEDSREYKRKAMNNKKKMKISVTSRQILKEKEKKKRMKQIALN